MPRRIPPLNALHAFVVTARHLNFTHAAKELFVTQGAVSRQITNLESYLGFPVFHRHARGLSLTPQGLRLLPEVQGAFEQLLTATERACQANGEVRLKAPTCSMRWLVPQLMRLQQAIPQIHVSLITTTEHGVDFKKEHFDAAVVFNPRPMAADNACKLFDEVVSPVMARHLYEASGSPGTEPDLTQYTLLHPTQDQTDWALWLRSRQADMATMTKNQYFDTMDLAISAAIQGFGIAMADVTLVEEDIRMGRLVRPFAHSVKTGASYYLVHRLEGHCPQPLDELVGWFRQHAP